MAILKVQVRQEVTQSEHDKTVLMLKKALHDLNVNHFIDVNNGYVDGDNVVFNVSDDAPITDIGFIIGNLQSVAPAIIRDIQVVQE